MISTERFEKVPIDKLVPYARNARTHSKEQILQLRSSLREFGFVSPCIITGDMTILAGHGRILAAKEEGYTEIPCVFAEHLTEAQKRAYIIADNQISLNAGWSEDMLAVELSDLQSSAFDLSILGFSDNELNKLLGTADDVSDDDFDVDKAANEPPFVRLGDLWSLGRHRLLCGDATNATDVSHLMNGNKANMCITDAPYNVSYVGSKGMTIKNDKMKSEDFYKFLYAAFKNVFDSLVDGGAFYAFHSDSEKVNFYNATEAAGFHYSTTCIWRKNSLVLGRSDYQQIHEPIIYSFKPGGHKWYSDRRQVTVWDFNRPTKNDIHPTMKPVPLIAYPIQNSSAPNGIVLDVFSGSFATGIACEQINRVCYALELDEKYASASIKRFIQYVGTADGVSVERDGETLKYEDVIQGV